MSETIMEAVVRLTAETSSLTAGVEAAKLKVLKDLNEIDRKRVDVSIDVETSKVKRKLSEVKTLLDAQEARLGKVKPGGAAFKDATRQIEEYKQSIAGLVTEDRRLIEARKNFNTQMAALDREERNGRVRRLAGTSAEVNSKSRTLADTVRANEKTLGEERRMFRAMNTVRSSARTAWTSESKLWRRLTTSDSPAQTLSKFAREGVRIGPFNATLKGLTVGLVTLGPILSAVGGSLLAMAATIGGALTGALAVGGGAVIGFGQAFLGVKSIVGSYLGEVQQASKLTDAYALAVAKYGKNSEKATNAQKVMNHYLGQMSPTAQRAYKDLTQVQLVLAGMSKQARPALDRALASTMSTFRALAPAFAKNSVGATNQLSAGLGGFMSRLKQEEKGGGGFLNTTFKNANASIQPLLGGIGSLALAIGNIGSSASRHLKPLSDGFKNLMDSFLGSTKNKGDLNGLIDSLMKDFSSVGKSIGSAGKLLLDFFNIGRSAGRGLFDSLTSTFDRWDKFVNENPDKISNFFKAAADGGRTLGDIISTLGTAFSTLTQAFAPIATIIGNAIGGFSKLVGEVLGAKGAVVALQLAISGLVAFKVGAQIMSLVTSFVKLRAAATLASLAMSGKGSLPSRGVGAVMGWRSAMEMTAGELAMMQRSNGAMANGARIRAGANAARSAEQIAVAKSIGLYESEAAAVGLGTEAVAGGSLAMSGFTATLGAVAAPALMVAGGIGAVALVLSQAKGPTEQWNDKMKNLNKTMDQTGIRVIGHVSELVAAQQTLGAATDSLAAAQSAYRQNPSRSSEIAVNAAKSEVYNSQQAVRDRANELIKDEAAQQKRIDDARAAAERRYRHPNRSARNPNKTPEQNRADRKAEYDREIADAERLQQRLDNIHTGKKIFGARQAKGFADPINDATRKMTENLGALENAAGGNHKLTMQVAVSSANPAEVTRLAVETNRALQRGVNAKKIEAAIRGNPNDALAAIRAVMALQIPPKDVYIRAIDSATSVINGIIGALSSIPIFKSIGIGATGLGHAEGGIAAASGYTKDTARITASKRPRRRAMGRFNEPTLLVGEEGVPEYVIATNPAYRAQNKRYLAGAAHALGMEVVEAARGYTPQEWASAIINPGDGAKWAAKGTKDKKTLSNYIADHPGKLTKAQYNRLKRLKDAVKYDQHMNLTLKRAKPAARALETWRTEADAADSAMKAAESNGNPKEFEIQRRLKESALSHLVNAYTKGLGGTGDRINRGKIKKLLNDATVELNDSKKGHAVFTAAAKSADQDAIIAQLKTQLTTAQNESTINKAFASVNDGLFSSGGLVASGGPGSARSRGFAAGSGGSGNIIINTLHPGDPTTLRAIGDAATSGMGFQGSVSSPRSVVA